MSTANLRAADAAAVDDAAKILRDGGLVAFPTETVYGLGADATNDRGVAAIFAAKDRPRLNPLIVHVPDMEAAKRLVAFTPAARWLAERFWPGALTLVLPRQAGTPLSLLVSAGLDTVAVRVPSEPIAQKLLAAARVPIAAPSANASGEVSPTSAEHVRRSLGDKVDLILDGGPTRLGLESTVIGFQHGKPVMLRPGSIARVTIEAVAGPLGRPAEEMINAPGQLASHYAPGCENPSERIVGRPRRSAAGVWSGDRGRAQSEPFG